MWHSAGHFSCLGCEYDAHLLNSRPIDLSQESYDERLLARAWRAVEEKVRTVARRHLQHMIIRFKAVLYCLHRTAAMHLEAMNENSIL